MENRENLKHLFAGYFHQDWGLENEDWRAVLARFVSAEAPDTCAAAFRELAVVVAMVPESDLERVIYEEAGSHFVPVGRTMKQWLEEVLSELGRLGVQAQRTD